MDALVLQVMICWLLAAVFAVAAWHKLSAWPRFKASLAAYQLLPAPLVSAIGATLAAVELVAVVLLVLVPLQRYGLVAAMALLAIYAGAIGINVARGRTQIDCGCGDEPTPVSMTLVLRNALLIALGGYALSEPSGDVTWLAALVAASLSVVAFVLYSIIDQLIANRARHRRLWLGAA